MTTAFLVVVFVMPILRPAAHKINLVDRAGGRKRHETVVPLIGGLAMFAAICIALMLVDAPLRPFASLVAGMGILLMIGVVDDLIDMTAGAKLFAQVVVAVLMVSWGEVQVHSLGNLFGVVPVELGEWDIPFTVLATLLLINGINMADGTDGLAGGMTAVALAMLLAVAVLGGAHRSYLAVNGVFLAAVVGFLCFNIRVPGRRFATVFMGDSGSMMLGFGLAWLAVYLSQVEGLGVYPISIAWILVLPILDVVILYFRRLMKGRSPFSADREHLHHLLLRSGFSVTLTVWLILATAVLFGLIGVLGWQWRWPEYALFLGLAFVFVLHYGISVSAWRIMRYLKKR
ncbi:MraY family glycosyltransferase [Wenzhouxiangella sp. EGI_FJ10305]|uniref:MraY family glycosyltransferase n=1 Tax=Wenzhouxiangella sp. EGI_FJ10305 TaxID=3243768 RepID=UPI0035DD99A4